MAFIQVPADGVGKRVDTVTLTDAGSDVHRQKLVVTGASGTAEVVVVTDAAPAGTEMGLVVRQAGTVTCVVAGTVNVNGGVAISGTAIVAGTVNVNGGVAISGTAQVAIGTPFTVNNISATVEVAGSVVISGTAQVAIATPFTVNDISRTVQVAVATPFTLQGISTTVIVAGRVVLSLTAVVAGVVALTAGTAVIGDLNAISRTVQVAIGTPFTLQGISTTVTVAGNVSITGTVVAGLSYVIEKTSNSQVQVGDSANAAIRVNVVAGAAGGVSHTDGTPFTAQEAALVPIGGVFDDATPGTISEGDAGAVRITTNRAIHTNLRTDGGVAMDDSTNSALRVNVVAGTGSGFFMVDGTSFTAQEASFVPIGGIFDDGTPGALTENEAGVVRMTSARAMHVNLRLSDGTEIGGTSATGVFVRTATVALAADQILGSISRTVQVAIGTPFILQGISTTVQVAIGTPFILQGISTTVTVVGVVSISNNINISATPSVILAAGTANFGTLNDISRTVQVAIGTPFILQGISTTVIVAMSNQTLQGISTTVTVAGVVGLTAGAANIGHLNHISRTVTCVVAGFTPAVMAASHGPKCVTCSTSAAVTLIASPGAGANIYVTQLMVGNFSSTLTKARIGTSASPGTVVQPLAASGGGFVFNFDPPWMLSASEACLCSVKPAVADGFFTVNFFVI